MNKILHFCVLVLGLCFFCSACSQEHTHTLGDWVTIREADCFQDGLRVRYCETCGIPVGEEKTPKTEHNIIYVEACAASCEKDGNTEHWMCSVCFQCFSDSLGSNIVFQSDITIPKLGHTGQYACTRCGNHEMISFGLYPSMLIERYSFNEELISHLNAAVGVPVVGEETYGLWKSYEYYIKGKERHYMYYCDVSYNEKQYRGVYFSEYRPSSITEECIWDVGGYMVGGVSFQFQNGFRPGEINWFEYQPISWTVLSENEDSLLLASTYILDAQDFNHRKGNDYSSSSIRKWLNNTFFETAFSKAEKDKIQISDVDGLKDQVFLLSYSDVTNEQYGFHNTRSGADFYKTKTLTDYAAAQGAFRDYPHDARWCAGSWSIRTSYPNGNNNACYSLIYEGIVSFCSVQSIEGIVPAIRISK